MRNDSFVWDMIQNYRKCFVLVGALVCSRVYVRVCRYGWSRIRGLHTIVTSHGWIMSHMKESCVIWMSHLSYKWMYWMGLRLTSYLPPPPPPSLLIGAAYFTDSRYKYNKRYKDTNIRILWTIDTKIQIFCIWLYI